MTKLDSATVQNIRQRLSDRLNAHLCDMREGYDDSIVGFNEAWDVMRKLFDEIETASDVQSAATVSPSVKERAREFCNGAFAAFGVDTAPYTEVIAELIQGAIDDDRKRRADPKDVQSASCAHSIIRKDGGEVGKWACAECGAAVPSPVQSTSHERRVPLEILPARGMTREEFDAIPSNSDDRADPKDVQSTSGVKNGDTAASGVFGGYCTQTGKAFCDIVQPPHERCQNCPADPKSLPDAARGLAAKILFDFKGTLSEVTVYGSDPQQVDDKK